VDKRNNAVSSWQDRTLWSASLQVGLGSEEKSGWGIWAFHLFEKRNLRRPIWNEEKAEVKL